MKSSRKTFKYMHTKYFLAFFHMNRLSVLENSFHFAKAAQAEKHFWFYILSGCYTPQNLKNSQFEHKKFLNIYLAALVWQTEVKN